MMQYSAIFKTRPRPPPHILFQSLLYRVHSLLYRFFSGGPYHLFYCFIGRENAAEGAAQSLPLCTVCPVPVRLTGVCLHGRGRIAAVNFRQNLPALCGTHFIVKSGKDLLNYAFMFSHFFTYFLCQYCFSCTAQRLFTCPRPSYILSFYNGRGQVNSASGYTDFLT